MNQQDDIHSAIGSATPSKGGNFVRDGEYLFAVEKAITHQNDDGIFFVAELRVLESKAVPVTMLAEGETAPTPNPVGSTASLAFNLTKFKSAKGNARAFLIGVLGGIGYAEEQVGGQQSREACSPQQPLRGMLVRDQTFRKMTRGAPGNPPHPMTLHKWVPVPQTLDQIKTIRARLDAAVPAETPAAAPAPVQVAAPPPPPVQSAPVAVENNAQPQAAQPTSLLAGLGIK
jgi:hypothetical protein